MTKSSSQILSSNVLLRKRNRKLQAKVSIIILTDFICWVPFITVCLLHFVGFIDASPWYPVFSIIVLPLNSVINPLLYDTTTLRLLCAPFTLLYRTVDRVRHPRDVTCNDVTQSISSVTSSKTRRQTWLGGELEMSVMSVVSERISSVSGREVRRRSGTARVESRGSEVSCNTMSEETNPRTSVSRQEGISKISEL